jgi:hypothetical protein
VGGRRGLPGAARAPPHGGRGSGGQGSHRWFYTCSRFLSSRRLRLSVGEFLLFLNFAFSREITRLRPDRGEFLIGESFLVWSGSRLIWLCAADLCAVKVQRSLVLVVDLVCK